MHCLPQHSPGPLIIFGSRQFNIFPICLAINVFPVPKRQCNIETMKITSLLYSACLSSFPLCAVYFIFPILSFHLLLFFSLLFSVLLPTPFLSSLFVSTVYFSLAFVASIYPLPSFQFNPSLTVFHQEHT